MNDERRSFDWLTQEGAAQLARQIESYWRALGRDNMRTLGRENVQCRIVYEGDKNNENGSKKEARASVWAVRSNLINGLPPKKVP